MSTFQSYRKYIHLLVGTALFTVFCLSAPAAGIAQDKSRKQTDNKKSGETDKKRNANQSKRANSRKKQGAPNSQKSKQESNKKSAQEKTPNQVRENGDSEARLLQFVNKNHPELKRMLVYLRKNRPREFRIAILQIEKAVKRIESLRERDPERYEIELAIWKLQSRKQVLAAKLTVAQANKFTNSKKKERNLAAIEKLESQLKQAIRDELNARVRRGKLDKQRVEQRLIRIKKQIVDLEKVSDERIDQLARAEVNRLKARQRRSDRESNEQLQSQSEKANKKSNDNSRKNSKPRSDKKRAQDKQGAKK